MDDKARLQGSWRFTSLEVEGQKVPSQALSGSKIVIAGDSFTTISAGATYVGTFDVDATRSPRTIDIRFTEGPHAGEASLGIYAIENDRWTLCIGLAGRSRPSNFATSAGSGHALETLERGTT
jgi:uncharacterized protein (TIGR03067 family)